MKAKSERLLEICVDNYDDAQIAILGGASRLEVCSRLDLDGLTPQVQVIIRLIENSQIPIRVMIRNRSGDFDFSDSDLEVMIDQISTYRSLSIEGFVIGCLTADRQINLSATKVLLDAAQGKKITFHRAFDLLVNKHKGLEQLIDLGVHSVLTSGCSSAAIDGVDILKEMKKQAKGKIEIIAGGGIMPENVQKIIRDTSATSIHASLNTKSRTYSPLDKVRMLKQSIQ